MRIERFEELKSWQEARKLAQIIRPARPKTKAQVKRENLPAIIWLERAHALVSLLAGFSEMNTRTPEHPNTRTTERFLGGEQPNHQTLLAS